MFFGVILLIIGVSILLPKIPIFNIFLGGFLILFGLSMFLGKDIKNLIGFNQKNLTIFSENTFIFDEEEKEYITIFGSSTLSLNKSDIKENKKIEIVTIFGNNDIKIDKNLNYKIKSTTLFGSTHLPKNQTEGFGELEAKSNNFNESVPYYNLEIVSLFGNSDVKEGM